MDDSTAAEQMNPALRSHQGYFHLLDYSIHLRLKHKGLTMRTIRPTGCCGGCHGGVGGNRGGAGGNRSGAGGNRSGVAENRGGDGGNRGGVGGNRGGDGGNRGGWRCYSWDAGAYIRDIHGNSGDGDTEGTKLIWSHERQQFKMH